MNDKVSIIIPIYNAEKWLSRCLDSIVNQTYKNIEIILVNDGSSDSSGQICEEYLKLDNRIKVFHKKNGGGVSVARNFGLRKATGNLIQFVDSDDFLEITTSEILYNNITEHDADLSICGIRVHKNNKVIREAKLEKRALSIKDDIKCYHYIEPILNSVCNKMYKRDYVNVLFDEKISLGEDYIFNLEYLKGIEKVITIDESLYNVVIENSESLNKRFRKDKLDILLDLIKCEEGFCDYIYGDDYSKLNIYNKRVLTLHTSFKEIIITENIKSIITFKKYIHQEEIKKAIKCSKLYRIDYKIFKNLLLMENAFFIYIYLFVEIYVRKLLTIRRLFV